MLLINHCAVATLNKPKISVVMRSVKVLKSKDKWKKA